VTEHGRQAALVEGARAGEPEAIAELYDLFGATVYRVALRLMNSAADAEDVVQDVFIGLGRSLLSFEGRGSLEGWIKRVTSRTALMRLRWQRARNEISLDVEAAAWTAAAPPSSPADRLTLERALEELPDSLREVFVLKEIEGYSHQEIGEMLGIRPGTSKIRLYRARKELQKSVEGPE
jgi:RNA polymerase sigma-70 factor (ECF subfamily)